MRLLIAFGICIFVSHLSAARSLFFFHFPRSFLHQGYPSINSDRTNDEDNSLPHFPYFFPIFRHKTHSFWRDDFSLSSTQAPFDKNESKVNETLNQKSNVTDIINLKEISTAFPEHEIKKKSEPSPLSFILWNRILKIKPTVKNDWRRAEDTQETNKNETQQDALLMMNSFNYTKGVAMNSSLQAYKENCTHSHHHVSRYFFFWTLHWASVAFQTIVIILISCIVVIGLYFCRPWITDEQSKLQIYKIKSLNV